MAGTAKIFYALAVGMEKVYNNPTGEYRRIIVCRPNAQFDDNIGFLPGSEQEKIAPLMRPVIDNLEQILDSEEDKRYEDETALSDKIQEIFDRGIIQTEALNFIRGRSIAKTYLIIGEAQNMTPNQVKGIITRAGKNTKIILPGDTYQIDKPFLDERTNGLSYASEYMKGSPYCYQVTMTAQEYIEQNRVPGEERPLFHVTAPVGWMNDPNGLSFFGDRVHLFYQFYPYSDVWGPMHWGHYSSKDMISWREEKVALAPDRKYDLKGCFSGSGIAYGDRHILVYTGVEERESPEGTKECRQNQCIAVGDGTDYKKAEKNPVITGDMLPDGFSRQDFRDPKIWREEDAFYLVAGNKNEKGLGQIVLFRSENLEQWSYVGVLAKNEGDCGTMWECPDFFSIGDKHVLIFSPQDMPAAGLEIHNGNNSVYTIGSYSREEHIFLHDKIQSLDYGLDYYAPQTTTLPDGRRILIGWLQSWDSNAKPIWQRWNGMMTIPRELTVLNGRLIQKPVREIANYYTDEVVYMDQEISGSMQLDGICGRTIDLSVELAGGDYEEFTIEFAANSRYHTSVTYDAQRQEIIYDRTYSGITRDIACIRKMKIKNPKDTLLLRILLDRYSAEIFVNDGEEVFSANMFTSPDADGIRFICSKKAHVTIRKHDISVL